MSVLCETLSHKDSADIILKNGSLGIGNDIRTVALHKIWLDEKAGLAAAGAAHHQNIFVSGRSGILGAIVHGEVFGLGQQNIF